MMVCLAFHVFSTVCRLEGSMLLFAESPPQGFRMVKCDLPMFLSYDHGRIH